MPMDAGGGGGYTGNPVANAFTNTYNLYNQAYGPQMNAYSSQNAILGSRIGGTGAAYGQQASAMERAYNSQAAGINNSVGAIRAEQAAIPRQLGYYDSRQSTLNQQGFENLADNLRYLGFQDQYTGYQNTFQDLLRQNMQQQRTAFEADRSRNDENLATNINLGWSDAIGRGGASSVGFDDSLKHMVSEHDYANKISNTQQQEAFLAGLKENTGYEQNKTQIEEQKTKINQDSRNIMYDNSLQRLDTAEQEAKLRDRNVQLDYQARGLGLSRDQAYAQLSSGLAKLNLDQYLSVGQLMDQMSSNDIQRQQLASNIFLSAVNSSQQIR